MKQLFIVGNWKSYKTVSQAEEWLEKFQISNIKYPISNKEVIICPPFTLLPILKSYLLNHQSSIRLGAQDISPFDKGAYTGEVNGEQIKEFAEYVIIGHSERRRHFAETEEIIDQKIAQAVKFGLTPIVCVSEIEQINDKWKMINGKLLVAYEPVFAIGTGSPDTPQNAEDMAKKIKEIIDVPVLYGGSVTEKNVSDFTRMSQIDGVLVGGASLDPQKFTSIASHA